MGSGQCPNRLLIGLRGLRRQSMVKDMAASSSNFGSGEDSCMRFWTAWGGKTALYMSEVEEPVPSWMRVVSCWFFDVVDDG